MGFDPLQDKSWEDPLLLAAPLPCSPHVEGALHTCRGYGGTARDTHLHPREEVATCSWASSHGEGGSRHLVHHSL